jgi:hypothetical protein
MIACPNCNHQNPDGATQCEACYTPLPTLINCPSCGATVQSDASFCGQCGFNLQETSIPEGDAANEELVFLPLNPSAPEPPSAPVSLPEPPPVSVPAVSSSSTQLQGQTAKLLHVQTNTSLPLPSNLSMIHIGKPGGAIAPNIDVSGFPDSAIVSRVHANLRLEGDMYFLEDEGSSNGTYVNHSPLLPGNRHLLRPGDRIALGKEDKVTFIFQLD